MSEDETLAPLLQARDRIDGAIQAYLDKVAALRKRRDAVTAAINVVRAGDDEIMSLPVAAAHKNGRTRMSKFDEAAVERRVLAMLEDPGNEGELSFAQMEKILRDEAVTFSVAGLRRILATSPKIRREGEREYTRYKLR